MLLCSRSQWHAPPPAAAAMSTEGARFQQELTVAHNELAASIDELRRLGQVRAEVRAHASACSRRRNRAPSVRAK